LISKNFTAIYSWFKFVWHEEKMKHLRFLFVISLFITLLCLTSCGDGNGKPSEGLDFASYRDGTCYIVSVGECKDKNVVIPTYSPAGDKVIAIGDYAFAKCDKIKSVTIPEGIERIGQWAFENCKSLTKISVPNSCTDIGLHAFNFGRNSKYNFVEENNAYYIGNEQNPFHALVKATDYTVTNCEINEMTRVICNNAFGACHYMLNIHIPDNVEVIGEYAFGGKLETVIFGANSNLKVVKEGAFDKCNIKSITLPRGVTTIPRSLFNSCKELTNVVFKGEITAIEADAFIECDKLTSFTVPSTVTSISKYTFVGCDALTEVIFEDPNGWYANGEAVIGLEDPSVAADCLTNTGIHAYSDWIKY